MRIGAVNVETVIGRIAYMQTTSPQTIKLPGHVAKQSVKGTLLREIVIVSQRHSRWMIVGSPFNSTGYLALFIRQIGQSNAVHRLPKRHRSDHIRPAQDRRLPWPPRMRSAFTDCLTGCLSRLRHNARCQSCPASQSANDRFDKKAPHVFGTRRTAIECSHTACITRTPKGCRSLLSQKHDARTNSSR